MIRKLLAIVFLVLPLLAVATEPTVEFSPSRTKVKVGEAVSVDLIMQDFPLTQGGGLTLRFNPSVLQVTNVLVNNSTWDFATRAGSIDNTNGVVSDILFANFQGVSGNIEVASVQFEAIMKGRSKLKLTESEGYKPFLNAEGQHIPVVFKLGAIRVSSAKR